VTVSPHAHPLRRGVPILVLLMMAMMAAVIVAPFVGTTPLRFAQVFNGRVPFEDNLDRQIFFIARLPRALAAALVGGTLAAAGVVFQGLLRNPLATPYTLGVSAGCWPSRSGPRFRCLASHQRASLVP
jgi:iron complex transport system permease protein